MAKVNQAYLAWSETKEGDAHFLRKGLSRPAGSQRLGCSLYEIPPGGRDWAYHFHHGNEEAIYVLEGEGILQLDGQEIPLEPGDYVALPAGAEHAHRVHNASGTVLRFLCFSTMDQPDVTEYPETGRLGVFCGTGPGGEPSKRTRSGFYPLEATVPYWP